MRAIEVNAGIQRDERGLETDDLFLVAKAMN